MEKSKLQLVAENAKWVLLIIVFAVAMGSDVEFRFTSSSWTIELRIK